MAVVRRLVSGLLVAGVVNVNGFTINMVPAIDLAVADQERGSAESSSLLEVSHRTRLRLNETASTETSRIDQMLQNVDPQLFSEGGYRTVATLKSNTRMKAFMENLMEYEGLTVLDEDQFLGIVPYYSGIIKEQNFKHMLAELQAASWVGRVNGRAPGDTPLSRPSIMMAPSQRQPAREAPRLTAGRGAGARPRMLPSRNTGVTENDRPQPSGARDVLGGRGVTAQTDRTGGVSTGLEGAASRLQYRQQNPLPRQSPPRTPSGDAYGRPVAESFDRQQDPLPRQSPPRTPSGDAYGRPVAESFGYGDWQGGGYNQFAPSGYQYNQQQPSGQISPPFYGAPDPSTMYPGSTDYQNPTVLEQQGGVGTLAGQQGGSFGTELQGEPEPDGEGSTAPLSEAGYQQVALLKDDEQMKDYSRRILKSINMQVSDESGLSGMIPFYSGSETVQAFSKLKKELAAAAWTDEMSEESLASQDGQAPEQPPWQAGDPLAPTQDAISPAQLFSMGR